MLNKIIIKYIISITLLCCNFISVSHAAMNVKSYYVDSKGDDIRVTFALSGKVKYKLFTLNNPSRIVLDIYNGRWQATGNGKGKIPSSILKIRHGKPIKNKLRIVLDLDRNAKIKEHHYTGKRLGFTFSLSEKKYKPQTTKTTKLPASLSKSYKTQSNSPFNLSSYKSRKLPGYTNSIYKKAPALSEKPIIVIDAGHGGSDPGAIGKAGTKEKTITLLYAHSLRKALLQSKRYRVYMTRRKDQAVSLKNRVAKAGVVKGDIFISLHADSHPKSSTKGLSVYTLSDRRAKREARKLLKKAGKEEVINGLDLSHESSDVRSALITMAQRETKNTSSDLAKILVKELGKDAKLLRKTHRFASLAVLTGIDMPSTLIELGYLSNRSEEKLLRQSNHRKKIVAAIARSIDKYFYKYAE